MSSDNRAAANANSLIRSIPVSLGKPSLRLRLEAYYSLIAPEILSNTVEWRSKFNQIYEKYGGSHQGERKLSNKLEKKYGSTVRLLLAEEDATAVLKSSNEALGPTVPQHEENWYELRPTERGSCNLSFLSNSFDPITALSAVTSNESVEAANSWIATCPLHNNIDQCRTLLPPCDPLHRRSVTNKKSNQNTATQQLDNKRPKATSMFDKIAANACHDQNKGPFTFLYRMMTNRCRVRVVIRYVNCIRGTLTGYLLAFDKHMNMILRDVDEVYTPRYNDEAEEGLANVEREMHRRQQAIRGERRSKAEAAASTSLSLLEGSLWSVRQRHLPQLLVRGDNVVTVYRAESEQSTWPQTTKSPESSVYRKHAVPHPEPSQRVGTPGSLIYALQQRERQRAHNYKKQGDPSNVI